MDPASIVGLTAGCLNLAKFTIQGILGIHELKESYSQVEISVSGLLVRIRSIRHALAALERWGQSGALVDGELSICLEASIKDCIVILSCLDARAKDGNTSTTKGKLKHLWNAGVVREFERSLDSQITALQLLLTTTQLTNTFDQQRNLRNVNSQTVLRDARQAASLYEESFSSIYQGPEDQEFSFDDIILNSKSYRAAFAKQVAKNASSQTPGITEPQRQSPSPGPSPHLSQGSSPLEQVLPVAHLSRLSVTQPISRTHRRTSSANPSIKHDAGSLDRAISEMATVRQPLPRPTSAPPSQREEERDHSKLGSLDTRTLQASPTGVQRRESPTQRTARSILVEGDKEKELSRAVKSASLHTVESLLSKGVSANCRSDKNSLPCIALAVNRHPDNPVLIQILLDHGADAAGRYFKFNNTFEVNLFHILCRGSVIGKELSQTAHILCDHYPQGLSEYQLRNSMPTITPFQLAYEKHQIWATNPAAQEHYRLLMKTFLELGADINQPFGEAASGYTFGNVLLDLCARKVGDGTGTLELAKLLLDNGANIHSTTPKDRFTALMLATASDQPDLVALLLEWGASVSAISSDRRTAVHFATSAETTVILLENGALVHSKNPKARLPLNTVPEKLAPLLLKYGADIQSTNIHGATPLHHAATHGRIDMIEVLLAHGAMMEARTNYGRTPLMLATYRGMKTSIVTLMEKGADIYTRDSDGAGLVGCTVERSNADLLSFWLGQGLNPNERTGRGYTALHTACIWPNISVDIVKILCWNNADTTLLDRHGRTPLECAKTYVRETEDDELNRKEIIRFLEKISRNVR